MDTATKYIQKFLAESQSADECRQEIETIKKEVVLLKPNSNVEFEIHVAYADEVAYSVNPVTGGLNSRNSSEDTTGVLSVDYEEDGTYSWQTVIRTEFSDFDLDDSAKGFASVEECMNSLYDYACSLDEFDVLQKY